MFKSTLRQTMLGLIAFTSLISACGDDDEGPVEPDGSTIRAVPGSERQITHRGAPEYIQAADVPDWSPDGNRIAFVGAPGGSQNIWTVKPDGTGMTQVIDFDSFLPRWSPDGMSIAVSIFSGIPPDVIARILIVPLEGGAPDTLTPSWMIPSDSDWSPDGTRLVVAVADTARDISNLWLVPVDGSSPTRLTADSTEDFSVAWSPDGNLIAYASQHGDEALDLHVIAPDGTKHTQLTTTSEASEWFPSWSPDSKWIAFDSDRTGNHDVWAMPAAGGEAVQLTTDPAFDGRPTWSPDGRNIAFLSLRNGGYDLWTIDVELVDE